MRVESKGGFIAPRPRSALVRRITGSRLDDQEAEGPLFQSARGKNCATGQGAHGLQRLCRRVRLLQEAVDITEKNMGPHALQAAGVTSALEHQADIAKVQKWLGHASISTTCVSATRAA